MLPSKKTVSPPAGQERKQSTDGTVGEKNSVPHKQLPRSSEEGEKGSAGKSLPLAFSSFLGVMQNVATDGFKLMNSVGSIVKDRGLPDLAAHIHKCFVDVAQMVEVEELRNVLETVHKVPLDDKSLLCLVSVFVHCQVELLEKVTLRLEELLHTKVKGQELEQYLPQLDTHQGNTLASQLATDLQTTAAIAVSKETPVVVAIPGVKEEEEEVGSCHQATSVINSSDCKQLHLASEQEMKDVIDLLSGRKPALVHTSPSAHTPDQPTTAQTPPQPTPTLPVPHPAGPIPSTSAFVTYGNQTSQPLQPHQPQIVFKPGTENIPVDPAHFAAPVPTTLLPQPTHIPHPVNPQNLGPPPPVPRKPPPHLLHPQHLLQGGLLENRSHGALRPQASLDSALSRTAKTNTWPLRPGSRQITSSTTVGEPPVLVAPPAPNFPYDGFSSDVEFSQFVQSVRQRAGVRGGRKAGLVAGGGNNPWGVVGEPSWSPLVYDCSRDGRQWSTAEDSSNCSDESSSNGDWMIGAELLSQQSAAAARISSGAGGMQRGETGSQNSLAHDYHSLALAGGEEGGSSSTNTWPLPKPQPWAASAAPPLHLPPHTGSTPTTMTQVTGPAAQHSHHPPLGLTYSEPPLGRSHGPPPSSWDMAGY